MSAEYFKSGLLTFHKRAQHAVKKLKDPLLFRPGSVAPSLLGEDSGTRVTITTQSFLHDQCTSELPIPAAGSCWSMLRDCGLAAGDGSTAVRGTLDGFRMKVSLQAGRSYALSISGIIIGIAQWDPCMVLLACRPCLRWPLFSMRRPSQFCRFYSFSEDRKQLACDIDTDIEIDIDLDLATDFIVLFGDSAPVGRSPSYESLAPSHARTLATTTI